MLKTKILNKVIEKSVSVANRVEYIFTIKPETIKNQHGRRILLM